MIRFHLSIALIPFLAILFIGKAVSAISKSPKNGQLVITKFYKTPIGSMERLKFGGSIVGSNYTYPSSSSTSDIRTSNRLIFKFDMDARFDEHLRIYGQLRARTDLPQSKVRTKVNPQEAYLDLSFEHLNFRAGYQIFSWGAADLSNPTDQLNPKDYTDVFDFEKVGIPAIQARYYRSKFTIEGFWMPLPYQSMLPYADSRFVVPFLTTVDNPLFPIFGAAPANYDVTVNNIAPEMSVSRSQFGARVLATVGRFDFGLSYFNGYENVPHLEVLQGQPDPVTMVIPVTINEVYIREQVVGFNAATGLKGINFKLESALIIPYFTSHDIGPDKNIHFIYVAGGDYTFQELFGKHDLAINLEFRQQINSTAARKQDFGSVFQKSIFSQLRYKFSDDFNISMFAVFNLDNPSYYLQPEIEWDLMEDLVFKIGANLLDGPSDQLLGMFHSQQRFYASLKYFF